MLTEKLFLDLSAVIDTLDRDFLLKRMHITFGITEQALRWVSSHLIDIKV